MSTGGSITRAQFKKTQLDHLIDVILEADGDPDDPARRIADDYPTNNVQDYTNLTRSELDNMVLTKSGSTDPVVIPNALKKRILSLKGFWQCWGDNTTKDWTVLSLDDFEEYLVTDTGPQVSAAAAPTAASTPIDVTAITNAVSTAMLAKPPASRTELFMKNKGGGDDVKPLKEAKQWNTWQRTFLSVAHAYDFKDVTDPTYIPDPSDSDATTVFDLQQKHAFGILISNIKESSALPLVRRFSDANVPDYGDAQMLYHSLVAHYTQGLTGRQRIEIIERELDELRLDQKWGKTCESFMNLVDNKLKDHMGIAPDPTQYPDSWYITQLNRTLEPHSTLYQYIVNHQMQADSIASHLGTASATTTTYEHYVEIVRTFCQTIDHANRKATQDKNRRKALQAEFQQGQGRGRSARTGRTSGRGDDRARGTSTNSGRGRQSGRTSGRGSGRGGGRYHNWIPRDQFDSLDDEGYNRLIRDRISRGELQSNTTDTDTHPGSQGNTVVTPITQLQVPTSHTTTDAPSVLTGAPSTAPTTTPGAPRSSNMAMITPSPPLRGSTTSPSMDSGPNTLLRQLMSNASARSSNSHAGDTPTASDTPVHTTFQGHKYQIRRINQTEASYSISHTDHNHAYWGALVDSGANGGMAGSDTRILSTTPHAHVDITGVGGDVMERLPLVQCASVVETIDEGKIILIMSQYAHKPDSKTIHSKSQVEHFGGVEYDSAKAGGGYQMIVTHEGYAIPLHVRNGLFYMDMSPASDEDMDTYPHVFLTADAPWNPDIVDEEFFFDASDSISDVPLVQSRRDGRDPRVDTYGEFHTLSVYTPEDSITQEQRDNAIDQVLLMSQTMKRRLPDLDALLPNFGWVGKDRIRDTLAKTTQHYKADQRVPMRKHFRSRFPGANVRRLPEWFSMDTFIADEPAHDDGIPGHGGCTMAQVYGGLDSEFLSGHPLSSESALPSTLQDFIREYGAMEGLKSDNAKSETSNAMKDNF